MPVHVYGIVMDQKGMEVTLGMANNKQSGVN